MILIELINFVCTGSLLLCTGFLQLQQVGATCHCNAKASHCGGFSGCWAQALGTQASVDGGSLLGLVALVVGGILLDQGSNPSPLHWQANSYPLYHQGNPYTAVFKNLFLWLCWVLVAAWGIQFPDQGPNLGPLHWKCRVLATGSPVSPYAAILKQMNVQVC